MVPAEIIDARLVGLDDVVEAVARVIFSGGTVAYPSDTGYAIGCDPHRSDAVDRIYVEKGRPDHRPLTLHVASAAEFLEYAPGNSLAALAAKRLMPGPVTLVVRKPTFVTDDLTAGLPVIGFRVPDEPIARAILERCGPLAAVGAHAAGAMPYRGDGDRTGLAAADLLIEHGSTRYDRESTVIDVSGSRPRLLREGVVPMERLVELLGAVERPTVKVRTP